MLGAGYASGVIGQAFNFDGVDDYVHVGVRDDIGVNEDGPFTVSAWVNPLDLARTAPQVVVSNYMGERGGTGDYSTHMFYVGTQLYFGVGQRQIAGINVLATLTPGWHLLTGTYDGSTLTLYVDGVQADTGARNFSGATPNTRGWNFGDFSPETNWSHLNLGGADRNGALTGQLDEIQFFNRALSGAEVASLFQAAGEVCAPPHPTLDVDANTVGNRYAATTDGLLVLRYLLGLNGTALSTHALADGAARDDAAVLAYLDAMRWAIDVDDNGVVEPATDGVMILRYLLGIRGAALIADALGANASRADADAVAQWLGSLTP